MKKLFTVLAIFATLLTTAQCHTDSTSGSQSSGLSFAPYVSFGVSMTNTNPSTGTSFRSSNYMSLEGGVCYGNLGLGAVLGRGSLKGSFASDDHIMNYYTEVKSTVTQSIGNVNVTGLFGYGCYFSANQHNFIEYGVGMSYNLNKFAYGATFSNWDGLNYVTPSVTYNF